MKTETTILKIFILTGIIGILISLVSVYLYWDVIELPMGGATLKRLRIEEEYHKYREDMLKQDHPISHVPIMVWGVAMFFLVSEAIYLYASDMYEKYIKRSDRVKASMISLAIYSAYLFIVYNYVYYYKLYMIYIIVVIASINIILLSTWVLKRIENDTYITG